MSEYCKNCGSWALNIAPDSELCDVCYWKEKAECAFKALKELQKYNLLEDDFDE